MTDATTTALRRLLADIVADAAERREIGLLPDVTPPGPGLVAFGLPPRVTVSLAHLEALAACAGLSGGLRDAVEVVWERGRAGLH